MLPPTDRTLAHWGFQYLNLMPGFIIPSCSLFFQASRKYRLRMHKYTLGRIHSKYTIARMLQWCPMSWYLQRLWMGDGMETLWSFVSTIVVVQSTSGVGIQGGQLWMCCWGKWTLQITISFPHISCHCPRFVQRSSTSQQFTPREGHNDWMVGFPFIYAAQSADIWVVRTPRFLTSLTLYRHTYGLLLSFFSRMSPLVISSWVCWLWSGSHSTRSCCNYVGVVTWKPIASASIQHQLQISVV